MANPGLPFSTDFPSSLFLNAKDIFTRIRKIEELSISKTEDHSWVPQIISCLDLTSLNATDRHETITKLLAKGQSPLIGHPVKVAAVCVYQPFVAQCAAQLKNSDINIASVAGGFPSGQMDVSVKCADIEKSVALGANEIDVVINRAHPLNGNWKGLYDEVMACKQSCGHAHLKVIIATGELESSELIAKTSWVCMQAGADFIKTSTGMEKVNATFEAGIIMMRAISEYHKLTGRKIGFKPAGGIRTKLQAKQWLQLLKDELNETWADKSLFRIGASSLLDDLAATYHKL